MIGHWRNKRIWPRQKKNNGKIRRKNQRPVINLASLHLNLSWTDIFTQPPGFLLLYAPFKPSRRVGVCYQSTEKDKRWVIVACMSTSYLYRFTPEYQNRSTIELQTSTNSYTYVLVSYVIISDLSLNFLSCVQISAITCNNRVKKKLQHFQPPCTTLSRYIFATQCKTF